MFLNKFSKRDLKFSLVTGLLTGSIAWRVLEFLSVPALYFGKMIPVACRYPSFAPCFSYQFVFHWIYLIPIIPVLWILGVMLGYFLGQRLNFFNQFGKFATIGFTNAAVDFGVLNYEIYLTGTTSGAGYSLMKTISFAVAMLSSYIWNKYWAFYSGKNSGGGTEFVKFLVVTIISFVINVSVASFVVNYIHPILGLDLKVWANVGAVVGSAIALIFSFVGFKLAVFRK